MPRQPRPQRRQFEQISNTALHIASDGFWGDPDALDSAELWEWSYPTIDHCREKCHDLWLTVRAALLPAWIQQRPGSRPLWHWEFDMPKMPEADLIANGWMHTWFAARLVEPRLRLGGIGAPVYEQSCAVPVFEYGLPKYWA